MTDLEQKIFQKILESDEARRIATEFIRKCQESLQAPASVPPAERE